MKSERLNALISIILLSAFSAVIIFFRLQTFDEPLERDLTIYAVIGHELFAGKTLYADVWDHQPPAIYYTYALADKIFGYGPQEVFALNVIVSIAILIAMYFAGRAYRNSWIGGVIAAGIWVLLCEDLLLQANQPNSEVFINLCLVVSFVLIARAGPHLGFHRMFFVGLMAALASLYKQVGIIPVLSICAVNVIHNKKLDRKGLIEVAGVLGICLIAWGLIALLFACTHHWRDYYGTVFTYNRYYVGDVMSNLITGYSPLAFSYVHPIQLFLLATLAFAGCFLGLALKDSTRRLWILWLAYASSAYFAIVLPGHLHPHYYQLLLPVLAIGASWSLVTLHRAIRVITIRVSWKSKLLTAAIPTLVAMAVLVPLSDYELSHICDSAVQWSASKYGSVFIAGSKVGYQIKTLLHPNETMFVWGSDPGIYFYSQRRPAAGLLLNYHRAGPLAEKWITRTIAQLSLNPPELAVINLIPQEALAVKDQSSKMQGREALNKVLRRNPVTNWFLDNDYSYFTMLEAEHSYYALMVRPYGSLAARIGS